MTAPTPDQIVAATGALRTEADLWAAQSNQLRETARRAEAVRLSRLEAGIYQIMVGPYNEVVDMVVARCLEGRQQMAQIAATLKRIADTYDDEERQGQHRLFNLY
jgi:hypothetical protein